MHFFCVHSDGPSKFNQKPILLYLHLLHWPDDVDAIAGSCTLALQEVCKEHTNYFRFVSGQDPGDWTHRWDPKLVSIHDIQDLNTLTFRVTLESFEVQWRKDEDVNEDEDDTTTSATTPRPSSSRSLNLLPLKTRTASCCWTIDDDALLDQIRSAPKVYAFGSPIFELLGCQWYIGLCPNGSRVSREGMVNLFLALASVPNEKTVLNIKVRFMMGTYCREIISRQGAMFSESGAGAALREEALEQTPINLRLEITIIESAENTIASMGKKEEEEELDQEKFDELMVMNDVNIHDYPSAVYDWKIKRNRLITGNYVLNEYFSLCGLNWRAEFFGRRVGLVLLHDDYDVVCARCFIEVVEMRVRYVARCILTAENSYRLQWGQDRLDQTQWNLMLSEFREFTIRFTMELIAVLKNGHDVKKQL